VKGVRAQEHKGISKSEHQAAGDKGTRASVTRHGSRVTSDKRRIMQNKPNFRNAKMNASSVKTMNYEQITMNNEPKNKAKQTQPVVSLPAVSKVKPSNLFQNRQNTTACKIGLQSV